VSDQSHLQAANAAIEEAQTNVPDWYFPLRFLLTTADCAAREWYKSAGLDWQTNMAHLMYFCTVSRQNMKNGAPPTLLLSPQWYSRSWLKAHGRLLRRM